MLLTGILGLVLTIAVVGFIVYLIVTYIPMPEPFKAVIIVIAVIVLLLVVLQFFGVSGLPTLRR